MLKINSQIGVTIVWLTIGFHVSNGFYLPGLAPVNYCVKSEAPEACKVRIHKLYLRDDSLCL